MHHELFLALLGHAGDVVEARREGFFVRADAAFLTKPQRTMIDRLLTLGHAFATLEAFVREAETLPSIYARALAQGMDQFLQRYADAVVALEAKVLATKVVFPIPQMVYELEEYVELLPEMCKLVRKIQVAAAAGDGERKCIPGAQLLDLLHRTTSSGFPRIRKSMQELLYYCNRILFKQILAWILYGEIVDPYHEFFVRKSAPTLATATASERLDDGDDDVFAAWYKQFSLDLDAVPLAYFPISVAESVLFIGKSMQILVKANEYSLEEAQALVETVAALAQGRVFDAVAVELAMEKVRLHIAARLYREVVVKSDFVAFFKSLKGFFLLARGELFQAFIERSYALMTLRPSHKSQEDLNHVVWQQIVRDFQGEDDFWGQQFSIQLPLQSFSFKGFSSLEGLNPLGLVRDPASKALKHVQYDATAFSAEFSVDLADTKQLQSNTIRRIALIFKNDGTFVTPTASADGSFRLDQAQVAYVSIECVIESDLLETGDGGDDGDTLTTTVVAQIKASKSQEEETRVSEKVAVHMENGSSKLAFQLQYARQEFTSSGSGATSTSQIMYKKVLLLTVNGVVVMETKFDFQQALYLQASGGEYWLGLALTPQLQLTEWSLDKFSPKASWKVGSSLKAQNPSLSPRELWNYVSLQCSAQWPLQLLVTKDALRSYAHLFQFCFRLKRVSHGLERTWKCGVFRAKTASRAFSQACALRGRMSFVIRNIELYFQVFVIESHFSKCLSEIEDATDFDKVKRLHDAFLAGLVKKCYLHTRTVASALEEVVSCCWKFVEYVLYQDAAGSALSFDRVAVLDHEFQSRFEFFYGVLQHSEARDLIFLLDYNEFFSTEREVRKQQRSNGGGGATSSLASSTLSSVSALSS